MPGQSEPESGDNEGVLHIPQSSSITGVSPSNCLVSYPGHSLGESYPSAEKQSMYSTAPTDWAMTHAILVGTTTLNQSRSGSNGKERVFCPPLCSRASPPDAVLCYSQNTDTIWSYLLCLCYCHPLLLFFPFQPSIHCIQYLDKCKLFNR